MPEVVTDNTEEWSGDHCMDPDAVPGVLFTQPAAQEAASAKLEDLAAAILAEFGVEGFPAEKLNAGKRVSPTADSLPLRGEGWGGGSMRGGS